MAGKRITDLTLAPVLYPIDSIPVARDNQTIRLPGSAFVGSDVYEPHRILNAYSSRKYLYLTDNELEITPDMNNMVVAVASNAIAISIGASDAFQLGLCVELFSVSRLTVNVAFPDHFQYKYVSTGGVTTASSGEFRGTGDTINPYETLKIVHIAPGFWLRIPQGGYTVGDVIAPENSSVAPPEQTITAPTIIDISGSKLDLVSVNGTSLVSIADSNQTFISIQGSAAY